MNSIPAHEYLQFLTFFSDPDGVVDLIYNSSNSDHYYLLTDEFVNRISLNPNEFDLMFFTQFISFRDHYYARLSDVLKYLHHTKLPIKPIFYH